MGYWIYQEEQFDSIDEMIDYAMDNYIIRRSELFSWLDENFDASDILSRCSRCEFTDSVIDDIEGEYLDYVRESAEASGMPGEPFEFGDYIFDWVDGGRSFNKKRSVKKAAKMPKRR